MLLNHRLSASLTGAAIVLFLPLTASATVRDIQASAAQFTVLIDGLNPGSGVIVGRQGETHFVLTAQHVVASEDEYFVVTADGRTYPVSYRTVQKLPNVDLAILQFTSDRYYPLAPIADYATNTYTDYVYVAGWLGSPLREAMPTAEFSAGQLIRKGFALAHAQDPLSRGYGLFYTSQTDVGMSGGAILDTDGRLIGIHGRTEGEEIYDAQRDRYARLNLGFSSGIPIQTFLQWAIATDLDGGWAVETVVPDSLSAHEFEEIQAEFEPPAIAPDATALDWVNQGNQLYRLEQFDAALDAFDRAIQIQPDLYQAWYGQGQGLYTQGQYDAALTAFERVLELQPSFYKAWRERAVVLVLMGDLQAAVENFDRAVELAPEDYIAWYLRGSLFRKQMGWYEAALGSYDRALEIAPNFAEAWMDRGRVLLELEQLDRAHDSLEEAIRLNPHLTNAWYWKSQVERSQQQFPEALGSVEEAIQRVGNDASYWLLKAEILAALDRRPGALDAVNQALSLNPNDAEAQALLDSLR